MKNITLNNFTQLSDTDLKVILSWRNAPEVRQWMFAPKIIALNSHLSFVKNLEKSEDKLYFLVKDEIKSLGVISFTDITQDNCFLGIYKNPELNRVGKYLLQVFINYAFTHLKVAIINAEVFSNNIKAIKLYKKNGFLQINKKQFNEQELISMELRNENR